MGLITLEEDRKEAHLLADLMIGGDWDSQMHFALQRAEEIHYNQDVAVERSIKLMQTLQDPARQGTCAFAPSAESPPSTKEAGVEHQKRWSYGHGKSSLQKHFGATSKPSNVTTFLPQVYNGQPSCAIARLI